MTNKTMVISELLKDNNFIIDLTKRLEIQAETDGEAIDFVRNVLVDIAQDAIPASSMTREHWINKLEALRGGNDD